MTHPQSPRRSPDPADAGGDVPPAGDPVSPIDAAALEDAANSLADLADSISATTTSPVDAGARQPHVINSGSDRSSAGTPKAFQMPAFDISADPLAAKAIDLLADVNLNVKIELGRTRMLVSDVLKLGEGAVVELDKLAGDPVDIYVNDRPIARGEVLVLNENFCVRINEILSFDPDKAKAAE